MPDDGSVGDRRVAVERQPLDRRLEPGDILGQGEVRTRREPIGELGDRIELLDSQELVELGERVEMLRP